jgi:diguanylate cyclase
MNDNDIGGMRARMMAEQAVARMNAQLRRRIDDDAREGLIEAILKTGEPDKFLFRPEPFRSLPPRWSLSGMIARVVFAFQQQRKRVNKQADTREALSAAHYRVQRSGAVGLIITLLIALLVGVTDFGRPLEIGLQAGRDLARPAVVSGDIIIVAKDDRSEKSFGSFPWPRRYDAALVDQLRLLGAKTISFEQTFANKSNDVDDNLLAAAFDRAESKVWLSLSYEFQGNGGRPRAITPADLFSARTQQAYFHFWYNMFGYIENMYGSDLINYAKYPSQAEILAGIRSNSDILRPDYAIDHKSIQTISAVDIVSGRIDKSKIQGKSVFIAVTSTAGAVIYPIMGQGSAPAGYSLVIAAETLKSGVARELGYILPLLICTIIGIACILSNQRKRRALILIGGTVALLLLMFIGDRLRVHVEMVPALLALAIIGIRESTRSKVIAAMTTNALTGLPNLSHLRFVRGYQNCVVVAIKIERYSQFIGKRPLDEQRMLLRAIVARINVIAPECVVHQGDDGLFVFLVPPDSEIDLDPMPGQLHALFTQDFLGFHGFQRIGISVGINDDLGCTFDVRRAVAIDRAEFAEFVTLQAVQ